MTRSHVDCNPFGFLGKRCLLAPCTWRKSASGRRASGHSRPRRVSKLPRRRP